MAEQVKPRKKKPGYLKGNPELATIRAASGKNAPPDIPAPTMDYEYFVAFLRAHPKHPKNEEGNPSPFVSILKYPGGRYGYKLPDSDNRYGPIASTDLIEAGKDPLYRRHLRLNKSEDDAERSLGWGLRPKPRVEINVIVLKIKDEKGKTLKSGEGVGEFNKRAHILSIPGDTWTKQVQPMFEEEDHESDDVLYYDLFGEDANVVPVIKVELLKKGSKSGQVEWKFSRLNSSVKLKKSWIKSLINIKDHPTNTPHTEEELHKILAMTGAHEADEADEDDMDFSNKSDEYDSIDEDEVEEGFSGRQFTWVRTSSWHSPADPRR